MPDFLQFLPQGLLLQMFEQVRQNLPANVVGRFRDLRLCLASCVQRNYHESSRTFKKQTHHVTDKSLKVMYTNPRKVVAKAGMIEFIYGSPSPWRKRNRRLPTKQLAGSSISFASVWHLGAKVQRVAKEPRLGEVVGVVVSLMSVSIISYLHLLTVALRQMEYAVPVSPSFKANCTILPAWNFLWNPLHTQR